MNKDIQLALDKLKDLIQKDGVFYALLFSLFEDSHISISELDDYDPNLRISSDESHWLIGFLIQYNTSFLESYPKDINDFISLGKEIHDVLKELEYSYILFNVPNNLDSYNAEIGSYCFEDNPDLHRGYYISSEFKFDFVFSYNSKTEELEIATSNDRDIYFSSDQKEEKEKLDSEKEIYLPDIKTTVVVDYDGLNMLSYPEYKSLVLEQEERYKEDLLFIEKINKEEEEFYKNQ